MDKPKRKYKTRQAKYPVLYLEGKVPIRKLNVVSIPIYELEFVKMVKVANETGISVARLIAASATPCDCCRGTIVPVIYKGKKIELPKGLLSQNKEIHGSNISNKKRKS